MMELSEEIKRKAVAFHEGHLAQIDAQIRQLAEARDFHIQLIQYLKDEPTQRTT